MGDNFSNICGRVNSTTFRVFYDLFLVELVTENEKRSFGVNISPNFRFVAN